MNDIEEIYLPSHNQHQPVSISNHDWVSVTHNRLTKRFKIWIGVCTVIGIATFFAALLVPILLINGKSTSFSTTTTTTQATSISTTTTSITSTTSTATSTTSTSTTTSATSTSTTSTTSRTTSTTSTSTTSTSTTTYTTSTSTTSTSTTTSTTSTSTTATIGQLPLVSINGTIIGIYKTTVGTNSTTATPGNYIGQYIPTESPYNACDNNTGTKYLSFGTCGETTIDSICGLNTGLYLELQRGLSLIIGLQMCTGNDYPERDPFIISLEGSNLSGTVLNLGTSWTLIYNGPSGLQTDPGRSTCGRFQSINNTIQYKSYRFLVSAKRSISNSVQYSEVHLYGY
ncbi:unnamed protein product [Adineta steineri]|uniref:Uncharacterized protein n=1 Tax=Adineta steineri TaxID=433720 RepID=A0A814IVQ4_9BILA|nr:unnamed protein product [Adineta steineri]CAF1027883.1 unnamed protein product [Adineta steineri]CAF1119677.1 unnamed protein product [Adineta steineri]